ncbi:MAG TPA: GNAT family N-acetyltransferase [Terracidiphilus sp.]|nr:GNAT family N-acetyltransferase [Terracidiphilus sp.]
MEGRRPLFDRPLRVLSRQGDEVSIATLDRETAASHAAALVKIHNLIPFVSWSTEELLAERMGDRIFPQKWDLSIVIWNAAGEPIGFLFSYLRSPDGNFPCVSVYMHRMAIISSLQRRGIGRRVVAIYLDRVFDRMEVDYVTLQTNDNAGNAGIIGLYESSGFARVKRVFYPNKTDWLMACPRIRSHASGRQVL